eukprot:TRINITY_DN40717_c0_g1_i1.p1 TRINITY_DN40717_c0_g1~~TRINITY_DN40717_c0_g1_i1.p1  ORF type:complete len:262 (+),score=6.72 TRINITY_DN40717_c0_g1_i1:88-873(+)
MKCHIYKFSRGKSGYFKFLQNYQVNYLHQIHSVWIPFWYNQRQYRNKLLQSNHKQIKAQNQTDGFRLPGYFGIDVEYSHFYIKRQKEQVMVPAHVCLVDRSGVIFESYINPELGFSTRYIRGNGGVQFSQTQNAPTLTQIQKQIQQIIEGNVLVGHSLEKDLEVLGILHPPEMCRNTITYKKFQNRRGSTRSLKKLASRHLKCQIQKGKHNPCEDAQTALNLYLDEILPFNSQLSEQEMVEKFYIEIMEDYSKRKQIDEVE